MAPFKLRKDNVFHIQSNILIALVPIVIWGTFVFGTRTLSLLFASIISSLITEISFYAIIKNIKKFSPIRPIINGALCTLILPIATPFWAFALGGFIASVISLISFNDQEKGCIINPISASGIILFGLFGKVVNNYTAPFETFSAFQSASDGTFITTILQTLKNGTDSISNSTLINTFLGRDSGCIGEISALLILIGGIYLIHQKYISWHIPTIIISTVFLISFFFPVGNCEAIYCAATETLSGGVLFYSFFVAPLPSASPITKSGKIIFGVCIGLIIMLLRRFTGVVDGSVFAVGLVSCFSYLIDHFTENKYFAYHSQAKEEAIPPKTDLDALLRDEE